MSEEIILDHNAPFSGISVEEFEKVDSIAYNDFIKGQKKPILIHLVSANSKTLEGLTTLFNVIINEGRIAKGHPQYSTRVAILAGVFIEQIRKDILAELPRGTSDIPVLSGSDIQVSHDAINLLTLGEKKMNYFVNIIADTTFATNTDANFLHIYPSIRIHTTTPKWIAMKNKLIKSSNPTGTVEKIIELIGKPEIFTAVDAKSVIDMIANIIDEKIKFTLVGNSEDYSKNIEIVPAGPGVLTLEDRYQMVTAVGVDNETSGNIGFTSSANAASQQPEYRKNTVFGMRAALTSINQSKQLDSEKILSIKAVTEEFERFIFEAPISLCDINHCINKDKTAGLKFDIAGLTNKPDEYVTGSTTEKTRIGQRLLIVEKDRGYNGLVGELRSAAMHKIINDAKFSSEDALTFGLMFGAHMKLLPMSHQYLKARTSRGVTEEYSSNILKNSIYVDLQANYPHATDIMCMFTTSPDMANAARASDVSMMKIHHNSHAQRAEFRAFVQKAASSFKSNVFALLESFKVQKRMADSRLVEAPLLSAIVSDGQTLNAQEEYFPSRTINETKILKRNTIFMLNPMHTNYTTPKEFKLSGGKLGNIVTGNITDEQVIALEIQRESSLEIIRKDARFDGRETTWTHTNSLSRPPIPFYENELSSNLDLSFVVKKAGLSSSFGDLMNGNEFKGNFKTGFSSVYTDDLVVAAGNLKPKDMPRYQIISIQDYAPSIPVSSSLTYSPRGKIILFNVFDQHDSKRPEFEQNGIRISNAKGFFLSLIERTYANYLNSCSTHFLPLGVHEELKFKFRLKSPVDLLSVKYHKTIDLGFLTNRSIHTLVGLDMLDDHQFLYTFKSISVTELLFRSLTNSAKTVLYNIKNYPTLFRILKEDSLIDHRLTSVVKEGMTAFTTEMSGFSDEQKVIVMAIIIPTIKGIVEKFDKLWVKYNNSSATEVEKRAIREKILRTSPAGWNAEAYISWNAPGLESIINANGTALHLATEQNVDDIINGNTVSDIIPVGFFEEEGELGTGDDGKVTNTTLIAPEPTQK